MFDTHEFVTTIKRAGATEEQAVLVLKAVSMAIDDVKANRVGKGASIDSKGTLTDPGLTLIELQADMNRQLANLRHELVGVKNLRGILELIFAAIVALIAPLVIIAIAAISKHSL
jgi:hypothetical protein